MTKKELIDYIETAPDDAEIFIDSDYEDAYGSLENIAIRYNPITKTTLIFLDHD